MKNLFIYSGITLVVLSNIAYKTFDIEREVENSFQSRKEIASSKGVKSIHFNPKKVTLSNEKTIIKSKKVLLNNFQKLPLNKTNVVDEPIVGIAIKKTANTADELIAEDNLITENNISNQTQALDFEIINTISDAVEVIEPIVIYRTEKTADELIAEDNLITENNVSNETQALDFEIINTLSEGVEVIEPIVIYRTEKTADELIAEDNLITENNVSNETQALDFQIINKISKN